LANIHRIETIGGDLFGYYRGNSCFPRRYKAPINAPAPQNLSQFQSLADKYPDKLKEMKKLFIAEANS